MRLATAIGAVALATWGQVAEAAGPADKGWYVGFNAGQARTTVNEDRVNNGLVRSAGFTTATIVAEAERDPAYKVFGGYQLNKTYSLEASYYEMGTFSFTSATTGPNGSLTSTTRLRV